MVKIHITNTSDDQSISDSDFNHQSACYISLFTFQCLTLLDCLGDRNDSPRINSHIKESYYNNSQNLFWRNCSNFPDKTEIALSCGAVINWSMESMNWINRLPGNELRRHHWQWEAVAACLAGVKAGCVQVCRMADNRPTVWSHMASYTL